MPEYKAMPKREEEFATSRKADSDNSAEHEEGPGYSATHLHRLSPARRGSSQVRAQMLLAKQRTHGNRAVQRQEYSPSLPPFLYGPATLGFDYLLHSLGPSSLPPIEEMGQPTVSEMVQQHIATVQGKKAFLEGEQARKDDVAIDDAQRAITGLPPDWFSWGEDPPGTLETPEYEDVSPALNPWELKQLTEQREYEEAAGR